MNKTAIRNFAVWARNKLIADVSYRASLMGVTENGIAEALPQSTDNMQFFDIGMAQPYSISGEEIKQRKSLVDVVNKKAKDSDYKTAYTSVIEEVAYTWFNRMIAIRFMEVNDYLPSHIRVLSSESGKQEPDLVTTPFDADLFFGDGEQQNILQLKNDNKLDEVFRILFIKQCNALYPLLPRLFENLSDYTELLLNVSFIDQDGVVYHLIRDIPEEDFNVELGGQVEIIGWLYQYYNDEKKNEVININKSTVKKEDIPAATQLFTTDWVVRYIVDNSLGKYWIERHPQSNLKTKLEYFITPKSGKLEYIDEDVKPEDMKVLDPCMGSGHFLVYAFDVLMAIYDECGFSERDAAQSIIENNIYGLDIDDRASQLAYFAVMMKARQYNRRILNSENKCHVMAIQESNGFDKSCLKRLDNDLKDLGEGLVDTYADAKIYGSILQPTFTVEQLDKLDARLEEIEKMSDYGNIFDILESDMVVNGLGSLIEQTKILVQKYPVVVTNPPYLNKFDGNLKKFVTDNYKDYSGDLFSIFMYRNFGFCTSRGYSGFMTPYVWMFIKAYEKLRLEVIKTKTISSLIQMEYSAFEEATVPICAFVFCNENMHSDFAEYIRLSEFKGGMSVQREKTLEALQSDVTYFYESSQKNYLKIPGTPIAYWLSKTGILAFENKKMGDYVETKQGFKTGNNDLFLRLWNEINYQRLFLGDDKNKKKWFPCNKGGDFRKWYGNISYAVNWENEGKEIINYKDEKGKQLSRPQNIAYNFKEALTWSTISSGPVSFRYSGDENMFESKGSECFVKNKNLMNYIAAYLNSKVAMYYFAALAPTLDYSEGSVLKLPFVFKKNEMANETVDKLIQLSKLDWNSYETSIEFKKHPLI